MARVPVQPASPTPVFTDPTGRRVSVLRGLSWGLCAAFVVLVCSVAFTLLTQVPLPGLGGLLPHRPDTAPRVTPAEKPDSGRRDTQIETGSRTATLAGTGQRAADAAEVRGKGRDKVAATTSTTVADGTAAPVGGTVTTPATPATPAATPSGNANPHATTRTRNANAPSKTSSTRVVNEPDEHAATGHGKATDAETGAVAAPGRNK